MRITVNGETREADEGDTVAALLSRLGLDPARVAIEHNGLLLRRAGYAAAALAEGDRLEIVHFVGGG